jgi:hypothetical protein
MYLSFLTELFEACVFNYHSPHGGLLRVQRCCGGRAPDRLLDMFPRDLTRTVHTKIARTQGTCDIRAEEECWRYDSKERRGRRQVKSVRGY